MTSCTGIERMQRTPPPANCTGVGLKMVRTPPLGGTTGIHRLTRA